MAEIKRRLEQTGQTWETFRPLFSWDNNHSQTAKVVDKKLFFHDTPLASGETYNIDDHKIPIPPYSPDMHRIIEHVFNRLVHNLYARIYRFPEQFKTPKDVADLLVHAFFEMTAESIAKDVEQMPELYAWLVNNGGKWPPRGMR